MSHPSVIAMVAALSTLCAAANALAQQPAGEAQAAKNKIAVCEGCHGIAGYRTAFPVVYHVPKLGGQQAGYVVKALEAYKSGERKHPSMRGIAASLTEQDMADLAAYYSGKTK